MTENLLKAVFFLILFATLMLQLIFSDHRTRGTDRNEKFDAAGRERVEMMQDLGEEGRDMRVLPAGIRRTAR